MRISTRVAAPKETWKHLTLSMVFEKKEELTAFKDILRFYSRTNGEVLQESLYPKTTEEEYRVLSKAMYDLWSPLIGDIEIY